MLIIFTPNIHSCYYIYSFKAITTINDEFLNEKQLRVNITFIPTKMILLVCKILLKI